MGDWASIVSQWRTCLVWIRRKSYNSCTLLLKTIDSRIYSYIQHHFIVTHSSEGMQYLMNNFARAATQLCLKNNINKTQWLFQVVTLVNPSVELGIITVNKRLLVSFLRFKYLVSTVLSNNKVNKLFLSRMRKARIVYGTMNMSLLRWNVKCTGSQYYQSDSMEQKPGPSIASKSINCLHDATPESNHGNHMVGQNHKCWYYR